MARSSWVSAVRRVDETWGHEGYVAPVDGRSCGRAPHLRPGTRNRMTALEDAVILEAGTMDVDDVVRLEDRFDRV